MNTELDIRDIDSGQTYFVVASKQKGGRCILNGMFIAVWLDKKAASEFAKEDRADRTVIKQVKPE